MDFSYIYNLLNSIAFIIGLWKIFEMRGEKGWKSLIPCYNQYTLGAVSGDKNSGKKVAIMSGILLVLTIAMSIAMVPMMQAVQMYIATEGTISPEAIRSIISESQLLLIGFIGIAMFVCAIIQIVFSIPLYKSVCKSFNRTEGWWVLLWILVPGIAAILFAFQKK